MLLTTDYNRARRDTANRAAAWKLITTQEPDYAAGMDVSEQEQAIDDVIRDWCADYAYEVERGFNAS